jgi:GNAT superfamily N-acetyltransferase
VLAIVHATETDVPAIAVLLDELDRFYGATELDPPQKREPAIREALFGERPAAEVLLAMHDKDVVGFASYSRLWPAAGVSSSLFLKELYVRQDRQRHGVGGALMRALAAVAVELGCSRMEWQTEGTNQRAREFYRSLGDPVFPGKVSYRLEGKELRGLADR